MKRENNINLVYFSFIAYNREDEPENENAVYGRTG